MSIIDFCCKGSANRTKNQIYLSFSEVRPTFGEARGILRVGSSDYFDH